MLDEENRLMLKLAQEILDQRILPDYRVNSSVSLDLTTEETMLLDGIRHDLYQEISKGVKRSVGPREGALEPTPASGLMESVPKHRGPTRETHYWKNGKALRRFRYRKRTQDE